MGPTFLAATEGIVLLGKLAVSLAQDDWREQAFTYFTNRALILGQNASLMNVKAIFC